MRHLIPILTQKRMKVRKKKAELSAEHEDDEMADGIKKIMIANSTEFNINVQVKTDVARPKQTEGYTYKAGFGAEAAGFGGNLMGEAARTGVELELGNRLPNDPVPIRASTRKPLPVYIG